MTDDIVRVTHADDGITTVTLNRPAIHNAFDDTLIRALTHTLRELDGNPATRVVVLTGAGKSFSAGADLNWMRRMAGYSEAENLDDARELAGLLWTLHRLGKPTVARVQGAAFGGGVGLVAACDVAIASTAASFALTEVKLGIIPAVISPYVVAAIGERQARRYCLSAERFEAAEAHRIGLVHEVVAVEALDARIAALGRQLLVNGPAALAACKDLIGAVSRGPLDDSMVEDTARRIARVRASAEGQEGLSAFLEKRRPRWHPEG